MPTLISSFFKFGVAFFADIVNFATVARFAGSYSEYSLEITRSKTKQVFSTVSNILPQYFKFNIGKHLWYLVGVHFQKRCVEEFLFSVNSAIIVSPDTIVVRGK